MRSELERKVCSVITDYQQNNFLVAVSGGADSMALLGVLCAEAENTPGSLRRRIHVLHVDHGLRGQESKDDAEFVRAFCAGFSAGERPIPCTIFTVPQGEVQAYAKAHGTGMEAAARHFRRDAFLREAKRLDTPEAKTLILTAHNKNDALELSLMRILRGSGPEGLSAMPVKRGRFVRPLLGVSRAEIIAYLKEKKIPWRDDSSNTDEKFMRNKIRHRLIPFLDELFNVTEDTGGRRTRSILNWKKGIAEMAAIQSLVSDFICSEVKNRIIWENESTDEANFFAQPEIIREESIYQAIDNLRELRGSVLSVRRKTVRIFCKGTVNAVDLGFARIVRKKGKITLLIK